MTTDPYWPDYFDDAEHVASIADALRISIPELFERTARGESHWWLIGTHMRNVAKARELAPAIAREWREATETKR